MKKTEPLITIITPAYNRSDCMKKCWKSLCQQSFAAFQWLIIDDGSKENIEELVNGFKEHSDFQIEYHKKKNGGKHTALNYSHPYIKGKYVAIVDNDDTLTSDALEKLAAAWHKYGDNPEVGQIIFLKGHSKNEPICYVKHPGIIVDTLKERRIPITGRDCFDSYRTELFTKYKFPEFAGEKFIGEGSAFFFIELESRGVYFNEVLYIGDYRTDGLTNAGRSLRIKNPLGGMYNSRLYMNPALPIETRIKKGILYGCYSKIAGIPFTEALKQNGYKALTVLTYIPGVILASVWKKKYGGDN